MILGSTVGVSSSAKPFLKLLMPRATSPIRSEILLRPNSRTTTTSSSSRWVAPYPMNGPPLCRAALTPASEFWRTIADTKLGRKRTQGLAQMGIRNLIFNSFFIFRRKNQHLVRIDDQPHLPPRFLARSRRGPHVERMVEPFGRDLVAHRIAEELGRPDDTANPRLIVGPVHVRRPAPHLAGGCRGSPVIRPRTPEPAATRTAKRHARPRRAPAPR